ncbi:MAG: ATP-dependent exonuclease SbcCD, C subunit-like protein [Thiotrichales bacterium]|nr:ATP-dependent exonuclease SbcCD, C subunit-like protein [Thiotrichales bacterium]
MMESGLLDFADDNQLAGFRLQRLEVYNWGTFDKKVWTLVLNGQNTLLTGDIGSGKSTLVDAVTTLLVPAHRIAYNKAAGAEAKERNLRSYVMGYYRSTRSETGAKQEALRDHNAYSVILGVFYNEGFDQWVTLAQVFWLKEGQNQPAKLYVTADSDLNIVEHFSDFGSDIRQLRKRLRELENTEVFDQYAPYAGAFRRRFGLHNDQALELFHQTVSMKQVGNLTDFVREHMLEQGDSEAQVEALIVHFDDLNRAHELVLKAKRQIEFLAPMVEDGQNHQAVQMQIAEQEAAREALTGFFALQKLSLLHKRQQNLQKQLNKLQQKIEVLNEQKRLQQLQRDDLQQAIFGAGGDRLTKLTQQLAEAEREKSKCLQKDQAYQQLLASLSLAKVANKADFLQRQDQILESLHVLRAEQGEVQNAQQELNFQAREQNEQLKTLDQELSSLRQRQNNIDERQIQIRRSLCEALGAEEAELPFIGELLQVREEDQVWEGSIERILHNFALSLLVPESLYAKVSEWVERTRLQGRLVYYRVQEELKNPPGLMDSHPHSLVRKLEIKTDSEFYPWVLAQLIRRFNYACCEDLVAFRREKQAVTLQGQVKSGDQRHEKDDRRALNDRRFFVLGWSNQQKIASLEKQAEQLLSAIETVQTRVEAYQHRLTALNGQIESANKLSVYQDYADLDWQRWARQIDAWLAEKVELETTHDLLRSLQQQLETLQTQMQQTEDDLDERKREQSRRSRDLEVCEDDLNATSQRIESERNEGRFTESLQNLLQSWQQQWQLALAVQVEHIDGKQTEMRLKVQDALDAARKRAERLRDKINKAISEFRHAYPEETAELSADLSGLNEYAQRLAQLQEDDLPRFEQKFKEQLNQNAINQMSHFKISLKKAQQEIRERIDKINLSLADIDYNSGRFIRLELMQNPDQEIKTFYQDLDACVEGSLTASEDSPYAEAKFLQVKALVDRFQGRDGLTELDSKWTRKVTDVRYFFQFAASERWREDDSEFEHYSDSAGKSGGQKEKLAYTVLAASLAYQFGLEWGEVKSRSFRFVVIDEAFGRGSDDSARFGLELFKQLNLQLLVITPKQKIHVIEPYVSHVGFVSNPEGHQSQLRTLSIDEHLAEKARRQELQVKIRMVNAE